MAHVSLQVIKTDRTLGDTEDLTDLVKGLKKGPYRPILVLGDMTLVDGLRRIEAARQLGWVEIDAVVSDDYLEIRDQLQDAHKDGPPPRKRIYEFYPVLRLINDNKQAELKRLGLWERKDRPEDIGFVRLSDYFHVALNLPYSGYHNRVMRLYRGIKNNDPMAIELLEQLEAGTIEEGTAFHTLERADRDRAPRTLSKVEQQTILIESIRNLAMTRKALSRLIGIRINMSYDEFTDLIEQLRTERSTLYSTTSRLAKEAERIR